MRQVRLRRLFEHSPKLFFGNVFQNRTQFFVKVRTILHQPWITQECYRDSRVPVTLLRYPRLVKDCSYLYEKLSPVLKNVSEEQFRAVFEKTAQPDLAHSFNPRDR